MKQRNHTFDFLCGLCIIRMVVLHVFQVTGCAGYDWWHEVMEWSFYLMSFFFFKAGYFNKSVGGKTSEVIKDRSKRLLLPYLTCGLIGDVLFWTFHFLLEGEYTRNPVQFLWIHVYRVSDFYGNAPIWFLFSFYMMYVCAHFIDKWSHPRFGTKNSTNKGALNTDGGALGANRAQASAQGTDRISLWAHLGLGVMRKLRYIVLLFPLLSYWLYTKGNPLWMSLSNLPMGIFFFYLGHWWRELIAHFGRKRMFVVSAVMVAAFIVGNIWLHGEYTMHTNDFTGNPWGAIINTVLIVCGLSGLLLSLRLPSIPIINYIGQHSMVFFVLHFPIIYTYRNIARLMHIGLRGSVADTLLILAIVFAFCFFITPYFERTPWLSGRWPKKA